MNTEQWTHTISRISEMKVFSSHKMILILQKSCHVYTIKHNEKQKLFSVHDISHTHTQFTHYAFINKMSIWLTVNQIVEWYYDTIGQL